MMKVFIFGQEGNNGDTFWIVNQESGTMILYFFGRLTDRLQSESN